VSHFRPAAVVVVWYVCGEMSSIGVNLSSVCIIGERKGQPELVVIASSSSLAQGEGQGGLVIFTASGY